jgi:hypothetical protein
MKQRLFFTIAYAIFIMCYFILGGCKGKGDDNVINAEVIQGQYKLASATFVTAVVLDGETEATTNANFIFEEGLLGTSTCTVPKVDNTLIELASNGDLNLVCVNDASNLKKIGTWNYDEPSKSLNLKDVIIANPLYESGSLEVCPYLNCKTIKRSLLILENADFKNTNGKITLTTLLQSMPYSYTSLGSTADVVVVLEKQ